MLQLPLLKLQHEPRAQLEPLDSRLAAAFSDSSRSKYGLGLLGEWLRRHVRLVVGGL
mgnify:CR=1 FL=1